MMDLHRLVVIVSGILLALAMILYVIEPSEMVGTAILTILAFLFGKASNGWGRFNKEKEK